mmetsp:Transcript_3576/g.13073  ORF Transcript_3576/g.13073 Transcript_3576/m.13073 type:complete len:357 (+) Transcript_3576:1410-2480(+)
MSQVCHAFAEPLALLLGRVRGQAQQGVQPTRSSNNNVRFSFQQPLLLQNRDAAHNALSLHRGVAGHSVDVSRHLLGELARGEDDEAPGSTLSVVQSLARTLTLLGGGTLPLLVDLQEGVVQHRQAEGQGFSAAGFRCTDNVFPLSDCRCQTAALDLRGRLESKPGQALHQLGVQVKRSPCNHIRPFVCNLARLGAILVLCFPLRLILASWTRLLDFHLYLLVFAALALCLLLPLGLGVGAHDFLPPVAVGDAEVVVGLLKEQPTLCLELLVHIHFQLHGLPTLLTLLLLLRRWHRRNVLFVWVLEGLLTRGLGSRSGLRLRLRLLLPHAFPLLGARGHGLQKALPAEFPCRGREPM